MSPLHGTWQRKWVVSNVALTQDCDNGTNNPHSTNRKELDEPMFKILKAIYHQLHVAAVVIHVALVFGEMYHVLPSA